MNKEDIKLKIFNFIYTKYNIELCKDLNDIYQLVDYVNNMDINIKGKLKLNLLKYINVDEENILVINDIIIDFNRIIFNLLLREEFYFNGTNLTNDFKHKFCKLYPRYVNDLNKYLKLHIGLLKSSNININNFISKGYIHLILINVHLIEITLGYPKVMFRIFDLIANYCNYMYSSIYLHFLKTFNIDEKFLYLFVDLNEIYDCSNISVLNRYEDFFKSNEHYFKLIKIPNKLFKYKEVVMISKINFILKN